MIVLLSILTIFLVGKSKHALSNHLSNGSGYTSKSWRDSETVKYVINDLPEECPIYSNSYDSIRFITEKNAESTPVKKNGVIELATIETIQKNWPDEDKVCVVWFDNIYRDFLFTPEEILEITHLEKKIELSDGAIYFLSKIQP